MFTSLQTLIYQIRTDDNVRRKFVGTVIIALIVIIMIGFIIYVNTKDRIVRQTAGDQTDNTEYRLVSSSDFDISQGLEQLYGIPTLDANLVDESNGNWAFVNDDFKLVYNGQVVEDSPTILPRSVYVAGNGAVVNSFDRSYLYNGETVSDFISKGHSIVPALITNNSNVRDKQGYMFLLSNQTQIFIFETSDVFKNVSVRQIGQFNLRDGKRFSELRIFDGKPYLFVYSDATRLGSVEVWQINDSNRLVKSVSLEGVTSIGFGSKGFAYTSLSTKPTELSLYQTNVIEFVTDPLGHNVSLEIQPRVAQSGAYGTILADRCDVNSSSSVTCLVKIRKVISNEYTEQDKIIRYDFAKDSIDYPFQGIFLSGKKFFTTDNGDPFIIGQENRFLYRLDKNKQ